MARTSQVKDFVALTNKALGNPQIPVDNAGLFTKLTLKFLIEIGSEEWGRVMAANVRGTFEVSKAFVPYMKAKKNGKIINIASATVNSGQPFFLHFVASNIISEVPKSAGATPAPISRVQVCLGALGLAKENLRFAELADYGAPS